MGIRLLLSCVAALCTLGQAFHRRRSRRPSSDVIDVGGDSAAIIAAEEKNNQETTEEGGHADVEPFGNYALYRWIAKWMEGFTFASLSALDLYRMSFGDGPIPAHRILAVEANTDHQKAMTFKIFIMMNDALMGIYGRENSIDLSSAQLTEKVQERVGSWIFSTGTDLLEEEYGWECEE
ncbi:hypothetical protein BSKO_14122 [Bryopsis sp. KO-2023]|nr:hypothetical protein BSKO_14122 [Bryopsis sp. KO-2023]